MKIVIFHHWIPKVGGIESAVYNLAKGLWGLGHEVTLTYKGFQVGESLFRYAKVCNVLDVNTQKIEADVCIIASNHQLPKTIRADKYIQWIHSDYDRYQLKLRNINLYEEGKLRYVAVSEHAKKVIQNREGVENIDVIYNLLDDDFGEYEGKPLKLVTASRISPEKGFGRMLILAQKLKENNIRFVWTVYGDNMAYKNEEEAWIRKFKPIEEVYFVGYKSDITPALLEADYLVQLSDFEGCPLAVLEALKVEKPCLVTDWNGVEELIEDGKNGYILPMDMNISSGCVDKIVNNIPEFKYKPLSKIEDWDKILKKL